MSSSQFPRACAALALVLLSTQMNIAFAASKKKDAPPPEPKDLAWNLRDHYTFTVPPFELIYGGDNGQWTLSLNGAPLMDKVNASVTFADGREVSCADLGVGVTNRIKLTAELGEGVEYIVTIPAKDGISMRHSYTVFNKHPFAVFRLEVKNEGTAPVEIAKISPVIVPPGSMKGLGPNSTVNLRRFVMHGPCAVYSPDTAPYAVIINDPDAKATLAMGSLTNGRADATADLQQFSGAWQGSITNTFDPAVRLEPGQTLQSDPAFLCFSMPVPSDVDLYYAQAHINFPKPANPKTAPRAWVTVKDGESFAALQAATNDWTGVDAALVPVTWEGRPGSLEGSSPDWPRDMKSVASQLHQGKGGAGITVDPLCVSGSEDTFTAKSEDGRVWLNPANEEGMAFGVERLKQVAGWGFDFYVVAPSRVPNEVLKHFNISRATANARAFDMMLKAAGGAPVYAASRSAMGDNRDAWLDAAAATARFEEYSIIAGPVRLDAEKAKDISDETALAIAFCGAPIELLGKPSSSVRAAVGEALSKRDYFARPMDAAVPAPKLWQVETTPSGNKESLDIAIVSFTGARTSTEDDMKTYSGTPAKTSKAEAAGYLKKLPSGGPAKRK